MDLVSYALVTLDDTKLFLGISDHTKDEKLKLLINMATDYIESQTGRRFKRTTYTDAKFDGTGTRELFLNYPILSFTSLSVNTGSDNSENWNTVGANDYWVDNVTGAITRTSDFSEFDDTMDEGLSDVRFAHGKNKYRATYEAGYDVIPYDLQYACMTLVGQLMNSASGSGIKSESLGDHSITYQDITEVSSKGMGGGILEDVLSKYRVIPIA